MSTLFQPLSLRSVAIRNRIGMSPMCTYSSPDGRPGPWHLAHLGARAIGGAGIILTEATAVVPEGRISPADTGIWSDDFVEAWKAIPRLLSDFGAVPGIQLAHAGRKAGTYQPWAGRGQVPLGEGGWDARGPSGEPFQEGRRPPRPLEADELPGLADQWAQAARRAREAGFRLAEIHMAHGYLLHQFLSPLVNRRSDRYGGSLENRMRFPLEVAAAVRRAWPDDLPLFARISATDWAEGGWDIEQSVILCRELKDLGVDLIDCSSGGAVPTQQITPEPGFQVPFAARIRKEAGIATAAVGMITRPDQAESIVSRGDSDLVLVGREMLRDPHWALGAARELGATPPWPRQYGWAVG